MKTFTFIILCFLYIPFTRAQEKKVPDDKSKFYTFRHFKLDTTYAEVPRLAGERISKENFLNLYTSNQASIHAQSLKEEQQFIPGLLFNSMDKMPIVVPEYYGNMPVYIPDDKVHYYMNIHKIEPANTPNLIPLQ